MSEAPPDLLQNNQQLFAEAFPPPEPDAVPEMLSAIWDGLRSLDTADPLVVTPLKKAALEASITARCRAISEKYSPAELVKIIEEHPPVMTVVEPDPEHAFRPKKRQLSPGKIEVAGPSDDNLRIAGLKMPLPEVNSAVDRSVFSEQTNQSDQSVYYSFNSGVKALRDVLLTPAKLDDFPSSDDRKSWENAARAVMLRLDRTAGISREQQQKFDTKSYVNAFKMHWFDNNSLRKNTEQRVTQALSMMLIDQNGTPLYIYPTHISKRLRQLNNTALELKEISRDGVPENRLGPRMEFVTDLARTALLVLSGKTIQES